VGENIFFFFVSSAEHKEIVTV